MVMIQTGKEISKIIKTNMISINDKAYLFVHLEYLKGLQLYANNDEIL